MTLQADFLGKEAVAAEKARAATRSAPFESKKRK